MKQSFRLWGYNVFFSVTTELNYKIIVSILFVEFKLYYVSETDSLSVVRCKNERRSYMFGCVRTSVDHCSPSPSRVIFVSYASVFRDPHPRKVLVLSIWLFLECFFYC